MLLLPNCNKEKIYKDANGNKKMKKRQIGFTREEYEEYSLEDYLNKWALITTNAGRYSGKIIGMNERDVFLLPYYRVSPNGEGLDVYEIIYKGLPDLHRKTDISGVRSTSEEETISFCKGMNKKVYLQSLREKVEKLNLEKMLGSQTKK